MILRTLVCVGLLVGLTLAPAAAASGKVVGDANGDGVFDLDDWSLVEHALGTGNTTTGPDGLSDVALPCDHVLDDTDLATLRQALEGAQWRMTTYSPCHGQDLGTTLPAPPDSPPITLDDIFYEIATDVPEFGGLYFDQNGDPTVVLTDVGALGDAEDAIFQFFDSDRLGTELLTAVEGEYGFRELHDARLLARDLLSLPGVTSLDTNEELNRVWIGVENGDSQHAAEELLEELEISLDMVVFEITGSIEYTGPNYQGMWRPMRAGIQIGRPTGVPNQMSTCTMGPVVERYGARGYLTNSHCTPTVAMVDGVTFFQPNFSDPTFAAGVETLDPPLFNQAQNSDCPSGELCRYSDSTFVQTTFDSTTYRGRVMTELPASFYRKVVAKEYSPLSGELVFKSGRTTGQTSGQVTNTCVHIGPNGPVTNSWLCQYKAKYDSAGGDSGSPVYVPFYYDEAILYGIHWGRWETDWTSRAIFSPIGGIEADLGFLHATSTNGAPFVEFLSPQMGDNLGYGTFFNVTLSVKVGDHEDGTACNGCSVDWYSSVEGFLGTDAVVNGIATRQVTLNGAGPRILKARATDSGTEQYEAWVLVKTSTSAPSVWIDVPNAGDQFTNGIAQPVLASSFDPDTFAPLPCSSLVWSTNLPADGTTQGCNPLLTFNTSGWRLLTVTGTDADGLQDSDSVWIEVITGPASGPPQVTIHAPGHSNLYPRTVPLTLTGSAHDPDGKSPIQFEWILSGPYLYGGSPQVIATNSANNDQQVSLTWTPSTKVAATCGGVSLQLQLRATDADNEQGSTSQPLYISDPPC
jgi:hypothetical protein